MEYFVSHHHHVKELSRIVANLNVKSVTDVTLDIAEYGPNPWLINELTEEILVASQGDDHLQELVMSYSRCVLMVAKQYVAKEHIAK